MKHLSDIIYPQFPQDQLTLKKAVNWIGFKRKDLRDPREGGKHSCVFLVYYYSNGDISLTNSTPVYGGFPKAKPLAKD